MLLLHYPDNVCTSEFNPGEHQETYTETYTKKHKEMPENVDYREWKQYAVYAPFHKNQ